MLKLFMYKNRLLMVIILLFTEVPLGQDQQKLTSTVTNIEAETSSESVG